MRTEFLDLLVAHVGVEDLIQDCQLLGSDQLFIIEIAAIADDGVAGHVLDAADHLVAHRGCWFHAKNTSRCVQWKHRYINVAICTQSDVPVETGRAVKAGCGSPAQTARETKPRATTGQGL
jgi:hypothetical protein